MRHFKCLLLLVTIKVENAEDATWNSIFNRHPVSLYMVYSHVFFIQLKKTLYRIDQYFWMQISLETVTAHIIYTYKAGAKYSVDLSFRANL